MTEQADEIRTLIAKHLGVEKVSDEQTFDHDLKVDSLDLVELTMAAEEHFDVLIDLDDATELETVGDAVKLILESRK